MAGVRYIGSKARVADAITALIGRPPSFRGRFVEPFCGTGAVAERAARLNWNVTLNDTLLSATITAASRLIAEADVPFRRFGSYQRALDHLNSFPGREGFVFREYSPASKERIGFERKYFSRPNAASIDAIRFAIEQLFSQGEITRIEHRLLIADLMSAASRVANIAGTYGCFLRNWLPQASEKLILLPRALFSRPVDLRVFCGDVLQVPVGPDDVVYLDPPYTKRQYAAYYHILETIAYGDEPEVTGITGLRPWVQNASRFCYRRKALRAISEMIERIPARRIFLSYSSEGHVAIQPLSETLSALGRVSVAALANVGRYRPNAVARAAAADVTEFLIGVEKTSVAHKSGAEIGTSRGALTP